MIQIIFYENSDKQMIGFDVNGHAGYAKKGKDLVCAAVSTLVINTVNSLETISDTDIKYEQSPSGRIRLNLMSPADIKAETLLGALEIGISTLQSEYGQYLRVHYKEV